MVLIHRLLSRRMRFLGSNALCYSRAKLSFFRYVGFEMMDHNNRAGAYEWGLQTLNISIEVCAT